MEVTNYFFVALLTSFFFIGAVCYVVFNSEPLELPLHKLGRDFEEKLNVKSEELRSSTDEALTKFGLRGFQLTESMQVLQKKVDDVETKVKEGGEQHEKTHDVSHKKLVDMERKLDGIQAVHKELTVLEKRLNALEGVEKNLKMIQGVVERFDSVPKPFLNSTDDVSVLDGRILKSGTVRQLRADGIVKVEDLLLKGPMEIALSKVISESEAKNLQSLLQLLMIPGVQHGDAVLLLKSGVNSKQELALQDTLSLGAKLSKTAELYVKEGKIKELEKPTLEEIASWIRSAKM